jgi:hypothetical protein
MRILPRRIAAIKLHVAQRGTLLYRRMPSGKLHGAASLALFQLTAGAEASETARAPTTFSILFSQRHQ